jgi:hypothetical protein
MKTKFKELLTTDFPLKGINGGFTIASEILSIGQKAERIAQQAREKQEEDGEFAKFHASNIEEWMESIVKMSQSVLDKQMQAKL